MLLLYYKIRLEGIYQSHRIAIQNVSESLDLIQCTIEAILRSETEFQSLIAKEIARAEDPEQYISTYGILHYDRK